MPVFATPGGEFRDEIREPIYDTVTLEAGATLAGQRQFFVTIQDAAGAPKSLARTNLKTVGSLPVATSYRVQGMQLDAQNTAFANVALLPLIVDRSSIQFQVGEKIYWYGPGRYVAGRMQNVYDATGTPTIHQQLGWAATQALVFKGHHVVNINSLQNFFVNFNIEARDLTVAEAALAVAAGSTLWIQYSLKGLLRRAVQ